MRGLPLPMSSHKRLPKCNLQLTIPTCLYLRPACLSSGLESRAAAAAKQFEGCHATSPSQTGGTRPPPRAHVILGQQARLGRHLRDFFTRSVPVTPGGWPKCKKTECRIVESILRQWRNRQPQSASNAGRETPSRSSYDSALAPARSRAVPEGPQWCSALICASNG